MQFITFTTLNFILSFVSFILRDPEYYNVPEDDVAIEMGLIAGYAEMVMVFFQFLLGIIFDVVGRRVPLVLGIALIAVGICCIPLAHDLYPWFLIFRIMLSAGSVVGLNVPLLPDYVDKEYVGRA